MTISGWVEFHRLIYKVKLKWIIDSRYSRAPIIQNDSGGFSDKRTFLEKNSHSHNVVVVWICSLKRFQLIDVLDHRGSDNRRSTVFKLS